MYQLPSDKLNQTPNAGIPFETSSPITPNTRFIYTILFKLNVTVSYPCASRSNLQVNVPLPTVLAERNHSSAL